MANDFGIKISAVDDASGAFRNITAGVDRMMRPLNDAKSAVERFSRSMGFDRIPKSFGNIARSAADVAEKIGSIVAPLAAVVGISSITGVAMLGREWSNTAAEIARTAQNMGMMPDEMQALDLAGRMFGVTTQAMNSGLKALGQTFQGALYGRNQNAMLLLNKLGISIKKNADGSIDAAEGFKSLADSISRIPSAQAQSLIARTFGIEGMLPFLRLGRKGIEEYEAQARKTGAILSGPALAQAQDFQKQWVLLSLSVEGAKNSIMGQLMPVFMPLIDQIRDWIGTNKDLIATNVGQFAREVSDGLKSIDWNAVKQGARSIWTEIKSVVDWMGGWKVAAIGMVVLMNGSLIGGIFNLAAGLVNLAAAFVPVIARAAVLAIMSLPSLLLSIGSVASALGMEGLASVFLSLGAVIEATPIGWIITAIAGLGVAGYELYEHWSDIKNWWHHMWGGMASDTDDAADQIKKNAKLPAPRAPDKKSKAAMDAIAGDAKWLWGGLQEYSKHVREQRQYRGNNPTPQAKAAMDQYVGAVHQANAALATYSTHVREQPQYGGPRQPAPATVAAIEGARSVFDALSAYGDEVRAQEEALRTGSAVVPRGLRQNNPGNLRSWIGSPSVNGYAAFPTMDDGMAAMSEQLGLYRNRDHLTTIADIVRKWAPPGDNNNTAAYILDVSKRTRISPAAPLTGKDMPAVMNAMIIHEQGKAAFSIPQIAAAQIPVPQFAVPPPAFTAPEAAPPVATPYAAAPDAPNGQAAGDQRGVATVPLRVQLLADFKNVPRGVKVAATADGVDSVDTRIRYSMPDALP